MIYVIICLIISLISIGLCIYIKRKERIQWIETILLRDINNKKKELNEEYNKEKDKLKEQLEDAKKDINYQILLIENDYKEKTWSLECQKSKIQEELNCLIKERDNILFGLEDEYSRKLDKLNNSLEKDFMKAVEKVMKDFGEESEKCSKQIEILQEQIKNHRAQVEAINENIIRQKQLSEQENFYKINLSEEDIADLTYISSLKKHFNNQEFLNKVLYDCYIKKPLAEMIKRVLNGRSVSGIYKITYIKTGEIYIGRAVAVDKRWTEHCKSAFSIGSIASSSLHTLMAKEGVWNFTFELLEECPKEKLNEREKFYIEFYDTKNYGLNQKVG